MAGLGRVQSFVLGLSPLSCRLFRSTNTSISCFSSKKLLLFTLFLWGWRIFNYYWGVCNLLWFFGCLLRNFPWCFRNFFSRYLCLFFFSTFSYPLSSPFFFQCFRISQLGDKLCREGGLCGVLPFFPMITWVHPSSLLWWSPGPGAAILAWFFWLFSFVVSILSSCFLG